MKASNRCHVWPAPKIPGLPRWLYLALPSRGRLIPSFPRRPGRRTRPAGLLPTPGQARSTGREVGVGMCAKRLPDPGIRGSPSRPRHRVGKPPEDIAFLAFNQLLGCAASCRRPRPRTTSSSTPPARPYPTSRVPCLSTCRTNNPRRVTRRPGHQLANQTTGRLFAFAGAELRTCSPLRTAWFLKKNNCSPTLGVAG